MALRVLAQSLVAQRIQLQVIKVENRQQVSKKYLTKDEVFIAVLAVNVTSANLASAKKRSAPNAPAGQPQPIYGTLPHSVGRYQQSYDLSDIYNASNNTSTLPHPPRNSMNQNNNSNTNINNNVTPSQPQQFDNKVYERFEPFMMQASKASHKRSPSSDSITRSINLG